MSTKTITYWLKKNKKRRRKLTTTSSSKTTSTKKIKVTQFLTSDKKLKLFEKIIYKSNAKPAQMLKGVGPMMKTPHAYLLLLTGTIFLIPIMFMQQATDVWGEKAYRHLNTFDFLRSLEFTLLFPFGCIAFSFSGFIFPLILAEFFLIVAGVFTKFFLKDESHLNAAEVFVCTLMINAARNFIFVTLLLGADKIFRKSGVFLFGIFGVFWGFMRYIVAHWGKDLLDWYLGLFDKDSSNQYLFMAYLPAFGLLLGIFVQKKLVMRNVKGF
jgi:hypothetical protein